MSNPMDDIPFVGEWVKDRILGCGSFGIVVLWRHRHSNERLAIKSCRWGSELTPKHRERWTKEVEMLKNCDNENIVGTKELPKEFISELEKANPSKLPILCMEYCSGGDLRQLLNRVESSSGLEENQVRKILSDISHAVEFLHKNKITHRDLKPENIVMKTASLEEDKTQTKTTYKLIDLGYAKEIDSKSVCASFVGTLQYLAPELFYTKTYSNSVDFWSFGLLVFEVICGVRPFLPHMAPVQWIPLVKKKSSEHIRVYETFHGDIEYSSQIFPENHISAPFKSMIERWLRIALEYDPKLRGRDSTKAVKFNIPNEENQNLENQAGNVIIFSSLQEILSKKIIKVFSAYSVEVLSYPVDDTVLISTLKKFFEKDTKIPVHHQILLSSVNFTNVDDNDFALNHCNDEITLYLYNSDDLLRQNVQPKVPKSIQRCLEQPKTLYNLKNSHELYKSGMYFVQTEKQLYDCLVKSCLVKAENLKVQGKNLCLKHNETDKAFGRLRTMQDILSKTLDTNKTRVAEIKNIDGVMYLDDIEKVFSKVNEAIENFDVIELAWNSVTTRLSSATRRTNQVSPTELLNNFVAKHNFQALLSAMSKAYINYKRIEKDFRTEKQCPDVVKICYSCLKMRDRVLQELRSQPFVLRILDISLEFTKITTTIETASENINKLYIEMANVMDELVESCWGIIKFLMPLKLENVEVPYSVVSFQKKQFDIGGPVTNPKVSSLFENNQTSFTEDDELKTLIEETQKLRILQDELTDKLKSYKEETEAYDFSFLQE